MTNINKSICCIYRSVSPSNRVYIGQTWNLKHRYKSGVSKSQRLLFRSHEKYGADSHSLDILKEFDECTTQADLDYWEKYFIEAHIALGYQMLNIREGGGNNGRLSEETKRLIGLKTKKWTSENKEKVKEIMRKVSDGNIGSKRTDEERKKISDALTGKVRSIEHSRNISESKKGKTTKRKGQIYSEQALQNIREGIKNRTANNKPVLQFDKNGNFIKEWPSIKIASKTLNIHEGTIGGCVRGYKSYKTAGGYIWTYK